MPAILRVGTQIGRYLGWVVKGGGATNCCCIECPPCSGTTPIEFEVVSTGWSQGDCGDPCLDWNNNFILDLGRDGQCRCNWVYSESIKCPDLPASNTDGVFIKITEQFDGTALLDVGFTHNAVIACTDGEAAYHFQKSFPLPLLCSAISSVIPFAFSGGFGNSAACVAPTSILVIARPG